MKKLLMTSLALVLAACGVEEVMHLQLLTALQQLPQPGFGKAQLQLALPFL